MGILSASLIVTFSLANTSSFVSLGVGATMPSAPTLVERTICEALREAAQESGWPTKIDDDVPCGARRVMAMPPSETRRHSARWAFDEAVNTDGLVVEEHRLGSRVRAVSASERTTLDAVIKRCNVPADRSVVVTVQTKKDGTRGWTTLAPASQEKTALGVCVIAAFADPNAVHFPDDTVVKLRLGTTPFGHFGFGGLAKQRRKSATNAEHEEIDLALARAMEEHGPRVMRCFSHAGTARGVAAQMTVRWTIKNGAVVDPEIVTNTAEGGVPMCVIDRLNTTRFDDAVLEGKRVTYTFRHTIRAPNLLGVPDEMP